jgi:hypothetical protein
MDLSLLNFVGDSFDVAGKLMIAYTAISVHYRFWKEHKIDEAVFKEMKKERNIGILGIVFILLGFATKAYMFFT